MTSCGGIFDWDSANARLDELEHLTQDPELWNDSANAQALLRERTRLVTAIDNVRTLQDELAEHLEFAELAEAEGEEELVGQCVEALEALSRRAGKLRIASLLSGEADGNDCYIEVHAGAGGTESQDWADMLVRMYRRWAQRRDYRIEDLGETPGEEAGIKSATLKFVGDGAYGWAKTESGVHRLVRISPFDSQMRRHTSFASVSVSPVVDDSIEITIDDSDLRVDTYRASGAGGQHVNKTDSAVRVTHLPSGIVVECQDERSQLKNRTRALGLLRARLKDAEIAKRDSEQAAKRRSLVGTGDRSERIRTYNFPQGRVTDHRINLTLYRLDEILAGDLDGVVGPLSDEFQAEQLAALGVED